MTTTLFDPLRAGPFVHPNRIFMAPMTRARGTRTHVPTPMMIDYYALRASAGLIITEAIGISQQGLGWPYATGLWSAEQVAGWRAVTDAVHAAGGQIFAQLWHMGRVVHPSFLGGEPPVSSSATLAPGQAHTYDGKQPYAMARALDDEELPGIVDQFRSGARHALAAGFDGAQIHAANGYLVDQFLRSGSNHRRGAYGGPVENRIRLLREVTLAVGEVFGLERTGVRLSPNGASQGVSEADPEPLFLAATRMLSELRLHHLELREPPIDGSFGRGDRPPLAPLLRPAYDGVLIVSSDFDQTRAAAALASGLADAVAFGRPFLANPDLPRRMREGLPLAADHLETYFTQGAEGYLDYPVHPG